MLSYGLKCKKKKKKKNTESMIQTFLQLAMGKQ